jgi:hypothetical protein
MNKEQSKRILSFLLLKPAISSRNLTSLGLVGIFFGVYVAAGGKIEGLPAVQEGASGFGAVHSSAVPPLEQDIAEAPTPAPGLDTSRLQFGKKGEKGQPAAEVESKPASGGLDSLTDRLNKVGTTRRPQ